MKHFSLDRGGEGGIRSLVVAPVTLFSLTLFNIIYNRYVYGLVPKNSKQTFFWRNAKHKKYYFSSHQKHENALVKDVKELGLIVEIFGNVFCLSSLLTVLIGCST